MRWRRLALLCLCVAVCVAAALTAAHAADATTTAHEPDDTTAVAAANLASLLRASVSSALVSLSAAQFVQWAEGAADTDRHYTLVVFLTASQQCTACRTVERELFSVAAQYQAARYPLLSNVTLQRARHPAHHIFFLSFDAHRDETGEGVRGKGLINLAWFQQRNITKVPELILLQHTLPAGMDRGDAATPNTEDQQSADSIASTPAARYDARIHRMRQKRWERQQARAAKAAAAAAAAAMASNATASDDAANATDETSANTTATNITASAAPSNLSANASAVSSEPKPFVHCWRDPAQALTYPLSSGVQAAQLMAWIRLHTEKNLPTAASSAGSATPAARDVPLPRSQVIRLEGLPLASGATGSIVSSASTDFFLLRWFWNAQPFLSSLLLLLLVFVMWILRHIRFAVIPCVFFLWCVCGAMNNILKEMPILGMDRGGAMFFYPGHGSFVGESILMGLLYAMLAGSILALAQIQLWENAEERKEKGLALSVPAAPSTASNAGSSLAPTLHAPSSAPTEGTWDDPLPLLPGQIRGPKSVLESRAAARSKAAADSASVRAPRYRREDADPFVMTTAHWILLFVAMAFSAFSIIRSIYTKKNRSYNHGFVWP